VTGATASGEERRYAAVVLAGGRAARLGGVDKASVEHAGRTLLEHVLAAVADAAEVVVVGDPVPTTRPVTFVREEPRFGGPIAGLVAGVGALTPTGPSRERPDHVAVLAVDMPLLTRSTIGRLRAAAAGRDGAFLVGADGRRQLAGVVVRDRLAGVLPLPADAHGMAVHRLLGSLDLADVPAAGDEARDVDTWADLRDLDRPGASVMED
jgi:molybdopterin-guanine dinucleotide biosynthesis protein A